MKIPNKDKKEDIVEKIMRDGMEFNRETRRQLLPRMKKMLSDLFSFFNQLDDFRQEYKTVYPLGYVLSLLLVGMLAGITDCKNIVNYLKINELEIQVLIGKSYGIPSADQIRNIIAKLDPQEFRICFKRWIKSFYFPGKKIHLAADGTLPRAAKNKVLNEKSRYILGVMDTVNSLIVDVVEVGEKTNEKTAIKKILKETNMSGKILTTDALNSTKEVMELCAKDGGDFILPIKKDHSCLVYDIANTICWYYRQNSSTAEKEIFEIFEECEKNGGRLEKRTCAVCSDLSGIDTDEYPFVKAIGFIERCSQTRVRNKNTGEYEDRISYEWTCFALSKPMKAKEMAKIIREHWKIENGFHWIKDNYLREDRSTNRKGSSQINLAILRRITFNIVSLLDRIIDEIEKDSPFSERLIFLNSNLHLIVQIVFGWDDEWSDRLRRYYEYLIDDLKEKDKRPPFTFVMTVK